MPSHHLLVTPSARSVPGQWTSRCACPCDEAGMVSWEYGPLPRRHHIFFPASGSYGFPQSWTSFTRTPSGGPERVLASVPLLCV